MKIFKLVFIIIFISNCTLNKVVKHHGVHNLKKKSDKLELQSTNTNDVIRDLGIPSTKSTFDNDVWIYLERKITSSELKTLGRKKLLLNDVLILDFNKRGILVKKEFLTMDDMNDYTMVEDNTQVLNRRTSFVSTALTSLRQKINDPLGKKKAK
tara:strand:+ start:352 stop:813 length:462 start_codon:yes stop_codon:yes gene_type:complete